MFSSKFNFLKQLLSKLLDKTQVSTLDVTYNGEIFCNVDTSSSDTQNLDTTYNGQIFYGVK